MEKKEFYEAFEARMKRVVTDRNLDAELARTTVNKPGITYEGLTVCFDMKSDRVSVGIVVNLDRFCEMFEAGKHLPDLVDQAMKETLEMRKNNERLLNDLHSNFTAENLFSVLIPTKGNEALLETCPHRDFLDLSVIAKVNVGMGVILVKNDSLKMLNMAGEEVIERAIENSNRNGYCAADIAEMIFEGVMPDLSDDGFAALDNPPMVILTNHSQKYGATCLLDKEFLHKVTKIFEGRCYIIPASTHKVLALGFDEGMTAESLRKLISIVNSTEVLPEERLSDQPYILDGDGLRIA